MNDAAVSPENKPDTETALYVGAAATFVVALLPYVNVLLLPSYVVGALVAVWFAMSVRRQPLNLKQGAKLGFLAALLGSIAAAVVFDIIWQFFDYQLWQHQNAQLMLAIFRSFASDRTMDAMTVAMAQNEGKVFQWYIVLVQVIAGAIFAGIFGSLAGMLGVVIFRKKMPRATSANVPD
ncbi:MAG: hypothetical protein M3Z64_08630 [Verrucomicrobiota bacterium]|nr:hypothetical protein [Verrucomicrobiota bacterium]